MAADLRGSVSGQARTQNQRVADGLRQMSDQFGQMGPGDGSPAGQIVRRLGEGGRRAADYLEDRGPEGLLDDVQEFARRKPGTFLLIAAAAGFAIGRLGRAAIAVSKDDEKSSGSDAYREDGSLYRSRSATENDNTERYRMPADPLTPVSPAAVAPGGPAGLSAGRAAMTAPYRAGTHDTDGDQPGIGELIGEITGDLSRLFRQEVELAKAEVREEAKKAGKAGGMLGGAAMAAYLAIVLLSFALVFALGAVMPLGWAALIVAVIWAAIGAVLYTAGRKQLKSVDPVPRQTAETLKEDAQWLRNPTG